MADWTDGYWTSSDGIRLHYRDYAGGDARPPILCIPGLTRNARDFEGVAERLSGDWRLICVDLRGRGGSEPASDPATYAPPAYAADIQALIAELGLGRFVLFGTSLGGLVAMVLAAQDRSGIAGVLLNDVGPVIDSKGLDRIRTYVGVPQQWASWDEAAASVAAAQRDVYPGWSSERWRAHARRICREDPDGSIVFDYDVRIGDAIRAAPADASPIDLWPLFRALAGIPALLVRGAHSDLLSEETARRMAAEVSSLELAMVPGVGHAPTLEEPEAEAAIDRLLARIDQAESSARTAEPTSSSR